MRRRRRGLRGPGALDTATMLTSSHGVLGVVGYHLGRSRTVPLQPWNERAIDVVNAHENRPAVKMEALRAGLRLLAAGRLETGTLVSHRYPLGRLADAFAALRSRPEGFVKAAVVVSEPAQAH